jgi:hypothetical protein
MATFEFDPINRVITVLSPDTEITVQELINAIRDWEDDHLEWEQVADASGKETVSPGLQTAITLKLLNWHLKFEERTEPTVCLVRGGNLLAVDGGGNYMYPISPSQNVTVTISQSTAAALLTEWTQSEKDQIISDVGTVKTDLKRHDQKMTVLTI